MRIGPGWCTVLRMVPQPAPPHLPNVGAAWRGIAARVALLFAVGLTAFAPVPAAATTTWTSNLFVESAFIYQDPYFNACTAAATMFMLNVVAERGSGGPDLTWTPYRRKNNPDPADKRDLRSILAFEQANDTLAGAGKGSDAHGWRNALNAYGWGAQAMDDPARMIYDDRAYRTFKRAVRAAVKAIARHRMPVGILGWAGGHAQVMTGYVVTGQDPRVSNDFTVRYVFLSDPLRSNRVLNRKTSVESLRTGNLKLRFQAYRQTDSPYDDPIEPGDIAASIRAADGPSEWYRRWVLVKPVRSGVPSGPPASPAPTPAATDTPSPTDAPAPTGTPPAQ